MKKKKKIAVIFGGTGHEREVSTLGAEFILCNIDRSRYSPVPIYITRSGEMRICLHGCGAVEMSRGAVATYKTYPQKSKIGIAFKLPIGSVKCHAVIPVLHGDGGEDGSIQGMLEFFGAPFVSSGSIASGVCIDKAYTKELADALGIPTVPYLCFDGEDVADAMIIAGESLGYPMFIKPRRLGSSVGCDKVSAPQDFERAYKHAAALGGGKVIVEKYLEGKRELECAYFSPRDLYTPPAEVLCPTAFYSYSEKYSRSSYTKTRVRAEVEKEVEQTVREYSRRLVRHIGIRHLARIDYFLDGGRVYLNEINTIPGMTVTSLYPALLGEYGIPPSEMISLLIEAAVGDRSI
ncbi:MAG: D-alanine--D-alanine ligase [Clostridia bacterium]|nr:D-alanine--D-alanine ligase [Clostridia bacterium]